MNNEGVLGIKVTHDLSKLINSPDMSDNESIHSLMIRHGSDFALKQKRASSANKKRDRRR